MTAVTGLKAPPAPGLLVPPAGAVGDPRSRWLPVVLGQSVRLSLRSTLAWSLALASTCVLYVSIWPSMSRNSGYADLLKSLPEAYRSIMDSTGVADLSSGTGYLNAELFAITGPLLIIIIAVVAGTSGVAGAESSRLLDAALAQPVSRVRWVIEEAIAVALRVGTVVAATALALVLSRPLGDLGIPVAHLLAACLHLAALGVVYGALALSVGAATGRPALTRAVCGIAAMAGYLVFAFAPMASWLEPLRPLSPFRWYAGDAPLSTGIHPTGIIVLSLISVVLVAAGSLAFSRRDLRS